MSTSTLAKTSLAASLASLPEDELQAQLSLLSEADALALLFDWRFWCRPEQLAPEGDWQTWLILTGRGWGKSRTGAEWVRDRVELQGARRIALVGATAADVRDTMIEGPSGLLSCCPPWNKPLYEPSKRRVTWPNGAVAIAYSADEPNRLRGPQHDSAWCDEACFIAGTMVSTPDGDIPIEAIRPGSMVNTRQGPMQVKNAGRTAENAELFRLTASNGRTLTGTKNHPVFVKGKGFVPLHLLLHGDTIDVWDIQSRFNGMADVGGSGQTTSRTVKADCCTGKSTSRSTVQFLSGGKFTTRTATSETTTCLIWSRCRQQITGSVMARAGGVCGQLRSGQLLHRTSGRAANLAVLFARNAVSSFRPGRPSQNTVAPNAGARLGVGVAQRSTHTPMPVSARNAASNLRPQHRKQSTALWAVLNREEKDPTSSAPLAGYCSAPTTHEPRRAQGPVDTPSEVHVVSVQKLTERASVYNLEVDQVHEYYANGMLVHNCAWRFLTEAWDMLMFGLRMGEHPKCVVTTTPRPLKWLKELVADPTTQVTRGSLHENADNLAPSFVRQTVKKYEGTRLGRQEIDGEVLDDVPGALWTRAMIDAARWRVPDPAKPPHTQFPAMRRVVVAIDPAVTSGEDSDDTGISVAGLGVDGVAYVIADATCHESPDGWATIAVNNYKHHEADRIIGEVNNGGDMVESTIRTVDPNVPYKAVHASRGKRVRAEPISALYEQGRVKHLGNFADLEDQMCNFVPDVLGKSPDRLDALVWAMTELMLDGNHDEPGIW